MTNSQCSWKDTPEQQKDYKISTLDQPSTVRTILLVLDGSFEVLYESTIETILDAPFGNRMKKRPPKDAEGNFSRKQYALDDARLFTYHGQIWVSYREGKLFGYEKQVLNRVHIDLPSTSSSTSSSSSRMTVNLYASEAETLCCGRNMALIDNVHTNQLQALTWVDPVTVESVELKNKNNNIHNKDSQYGRRRLTEEKNGKKKKKKSDFHGTNGFMVYLPNTNEYLGVGHFHRPPGRNANEYAKFGHHYTHAFFTISDVPPFHLKRLSPELVLPSHAIKNDAEIIQFWSGLDLLDDKTLALSYGINDCEGAATILDLSTVENLLRDVAQGKEVVDLITPLID
jgi:hypothetical protein